MSGRSKDFLANEIHDRLMDSISKEKRKKPKSKFTVISLVVIVVLCGSYFLNKQYSFLVFNNQRVGRELTADFLTNTFTQKENFSSKTDSLLIGSDASKAIYLDKSENQMVLNVAKMALGDEDILKIKTGRGGFYKVELPDGSVVKLNSNSTLQYSASYLKERKLSLWGEAFFEVEKVERENKRVPFEVKTDKQVIEVLGTSFNVKTLAGFEETFLLEGRLNVKALYADKNVLLVPGDLIKIDQEKIAVKNLEENEIDELLAWKDGFFYYENRSMAHILADLKKYFVFDYDISAVPNENFTIYLARKSSLEEIIKLLDSSSFSTLKMDKNILSFNK